MRTIYVKGRGKKNAIWILLNVLTSLCMQGAPNCLHRFSSMLTVLYWSIDNSLRPSNLWFSTFLFTGKDQTNSTNCAFPICQTPFHYLHEIGKKIGSLERMTVLEWLFMCLSFRSRKGTIVPITVKMFAI